MDSVNTFIGKLENGEMQQIKKLGNNYSIFDWHYSYRNKIQNNQKQMLKFKTSNRNKFGFIIIEGNKIRIDYLNIKFN
jgi:hypothetical protein